MPYLFATEDQNFEDFSSGRVLYNLPGAPAFPVRLISEMFQRAAALLPKRLLTLYDPCCGGAYHLSALGFLHGEQIGAILASDVDDRALGLAQRNLSLLSQQGLTRREAEIQDMLAQYGKTSHAEALESVKTLRKMLEKKPTGHEIRTRTFLANAMDADAVRAGLAGETIDLILTDIPYGQLSSWQMPQPAQSLDFAQHDPVWHVLDALLTILSNEAVVVVAADKNQKVAHANYQRAGRFQVGKRQVSLLRRTSA